MTNSFPRAVVFIFLLFTIANHGLCAQPTTKGTEFWMAFMENLDVMFNGPAQFSFEIASDYNTSGTIEMPQTGYVLPFTVAAGTVSEILLPQAVYHPVGSEYIDITGFKIVAADPVSVTVMHHKYYFHEASIVLPLTEVGSDYMVMCHKDDGPTAAGYSEFIIEATEDNTVIDITPSVMTRSLHPPGVTFAVTLNKGNVYQVQSSSDLTGSAIVARNGKKIAVFSGANRANVGCYYADDHLYDQSYPNSFWRNDYMAMPFSWQGDEVRVLAKENNTKVYFNCGTPKTLDRGEYFDTIVYSPVRIRSSVPIAAGQFKRSQDCSTLGDPTFLALAPLEMKATHALFNSLVSAIPSTVFTNHYANVLVETANVLEFTCDGSTPVFSPVPQNARYSWARIVLQPGSHEMISDSGFFAIAYGVSQNDAYSYSIGYDMRKPDLTGSIIFTTTAPVCADSSVSFTPNSSGALSNWQWDFGDGGTSQQQNPTYVYTSVGTYIVNLFADSAGCPQSATQTVSITDCSDECDPFVPNIFSPNGDSHNDVICVQGSCIATVHFRIYDRWGELIFESTDKATCWDGTYHGKQLNAGVFVYQLSGTRTSGTAFEKSGNITLIR